MNFKIIKKITFIFISLFFILNTFTFATNNINIDTNNLTSLENAIISNPNLKKKALSSKMDNLDVEDVIDIYEELSKTYTNDELANMIVESSPELQKEGIDTETIKVGTDLLRNSDSKEIVKILREDLNISEIKKTLGDNYTSKELSNAIFDQMTPAKVSSIAFKLLLANYIIKKVLVALIIMFVILIISKWVIFKKAGKHGFASIIPLYNKIVLYSICDISPWVLLLLLLPIIGWFILGIINIITCFLLPKAINRSAWFGLGLLFFPIIFYPILAFTRNKKNNY